MSNVKTVVMCVGVEDNHLEEQLSSIDEVTVYNVTDTAGVFMYGNERKKQFVEYSKSMINEADYIVTCVSGKSQDNSCVAVLVSQAAKELDKPVLVVISDSDECDMIGMIENVADSVICISNSTVAKCYEGNNKFYADADDIKNAMTLACLYGVIGILYRPGILDIDFEEYLEVITKYKRVDFCFGRSMVIGDGALETVLDESLELIAANGQKGDLIYVMCDVMDLRLVQGYFNLLRKGPEDLNAQLTSVMLSPEVKRAIVKNEDSKGKLNREFIAFSYVGRE